MLNKPLIDSRGPVGMIAKSTVYGFGGGTAINLFDKKVLKGKLTSLGANLPFNINAKPVNLNLTDAGALLIVNGLKVPTPKTMIPMVIVIIIKKIGEAFDYIDPPSPMDPRDPNATNVTRARREREAPAMVTYR